MAYLSITELNKALLSQLETEKERAKYLLQFEVTTRVTIENLTPKAQAVIGDIGLPFTGDDAQQVIKDARAWLQEKAA
ncbi:hypothetical protein [Pseudoalteromonas sp. PAR1]|uniref:hypothetical protein n=1 Tax=Pseudoalteromonas sp. PAR1 TaxID=2853443 RepID=UPI000C49744A|nr:hypothetical protein [Pseudoalteromonas sp. PAR1]MBB31947.1 hypothetical protein [Gemmatimonadota bacterium]MBU76778.1 hypothetical protein [Pseudoalteromonadaceae bacterium]|tara:strand:+ start:15876 stop:16109 length:234 start_codon:yes stop_codon:yes gene_type:complete